MPSGLVLDANLTPPAWDLLTAGATPVVAVEVPAPWTPACRARLTSSDGDEAATALGAARETLERAAGLGAKIAVVRLGSVPSLERDWPLFRDAFHRGALTVSRARRFAVERELAGDGDGDRALKVLERLARDAEGRNLTLAILNPRRVIDLPSPTELSRLLRELRGAAIAPAFDLAAAHLPDAMGVWPYFHSEAAFGAAPQSPMSATPADHSPAFRPAAAS